MQISFQRNIAARQDAFTLIELLVVLAIIGVLASLIVGLAGLAGRKSKEAQVRAQLNGFITVIERYKSEFGYYPPDNVLTDASLRTRARKVAVGLRVSDRVVRRVVILVNDDCALVVKFREADLHQGFRNLKLVRLRGVFGQFAIQLCSVIEFSYRTAHSLLLFASLRTLGYGLTIAVTSDGCLYHLGLSEPTVTEPSNKTFEGVSP
jgi:prepilin-type N-terminal cleavage/methylation domain-containing protein